MEAVEGVGVEEEEVALVENFHALRIQFHSFPLSLSFLYVELFYTFASVFDCLPLVGEGVVAEEVEQATLVAVEATAIAVGNEVHKYQQEFP